MIYTSFRWLFKLLYPIYFKEHIVLHKERFLIDPPIILISNHPNTLIDVVAVAKELNHPVSFLANIGLFSTKFSNWLFSNLFCIPIERPTDVKGRKIDNTASFQRSYDHLNSNNSIFIAAEGYSTMQRVKHTFKTGAARIAMGAMKHNDYKKEIWILPVSVIYDKPNFFRSRIMIVPSLPINLGDYVEDYQKDEQKTVKKITQEVQKRVYANSIYFDTEDALDRFQKWEQVYRAQYKEPLDIETPYLMKVRDLIQEERLPISYQNEIDDLWQTLEKSDISYKGLALALTQKTSWVYLILIGPLYILGSLLNGLPSLLAIFIVRRLKLYVGYNSTAKMSIGWFIFSIYYLVQYFILRQWLDGPLSLVITILALPLGLVAFGYHKYLQELWMVYKINRKLGSNHVLSQELTKKRSSVLKYLKEMTQHT